MEFDQAFARLIGHEGGYVNHPSDPGGETKFGISKRSYPNEDIANLTLERAKEIYRRDFWDAAGCDIWPEAIRFEMFDAGVNMGVRTAVQMLQRALGVPDDGIAGPMTRGRAQMADPAWLLKRLQAHRLISYTRLKTFSAFGAGWVRRVAANMLEV